MTTAERAAASDVSYPLCSFLPFQTANAALVCGLEPGGISISPQTPLNRPGKPLRFSWIFPAKFDRYAQKIVFPYIPCLSLWERCLSEAKTERVNCDCQSPLSRLRRQLSQRESQGERWNLTFYWRYGRLNVVLLNPKAPTQRRAVWPTSSRKGGCTYADHFDVPYFWIFSHDPHKRQKPPLWQVTVSKSLTFDSL